LVYIGFDFKSPIFNDSPSSVNAFYRKIGEVEYEEAKKKQKDGSEQNEGSDRELPNPRQKGF